MYVTRSSRIWLLSLSTKLRTRLSCSLLEQSVTSSAIGVKIIYVLPFEPERESLLNMITKNVILSISRRVYSISGSIIMQRDHEVLNHMRLHRTLMPPLFSVSLRSKYKALSQCPWRGTFFCLQKMMVSKIDMIFCWWFSAIRAARTYIIQLWLHALLPTWHKFDELIHLLQWLPYDSLYLSGNLASPKLS